MTLDEFLSLKKGDKVRVVPGYTEAIRKVDFTPEMEPYFGKELTIKRVEEDDWESHDYSRAQVEENGFWWSACEFESKVKPVGLEEII